MSDPFASAHFKVVAACGLLDAAWFAALGTHVAAWVVVGFAWVFGREVWPRVAIACTSGAIVMLTLWLLIRVAIDRRLFVALAQVPVSQDPDGALDALDQALLELGWINGKGVARSLEARVEGVIGLLRKVCALTLLQIMVLFAAVCAATWIG